MSRTLVFSIVLSLAGIGIGTAQTNKVEVTNFPSVQEISGAISVARPIPQTALVRLGEVIVPPVGPQETTALVDGGILSVEGFPAVTLSLMGRMQSAGFADGAVGVVLIPTETTVAEVFELTGRTDFDLRIAAPVRPQDGSYFSAQAPRLPVGFSSYRVLYYNTSDHSATVHLFAYLTH